MTRDIIETKNKIYNAYKELILTLRAYKTILILFKKEYLPQFGYVGDIRKVYPFEYVIEGRELDFAFELKEELHIYEVTILKKLDKEQIEKEVEAKMKNINFNRKSKIYFIFITDNKESFEKIAIDDENVLVMYINSTKSYIRRKNHIEDINHELDINPGDIIKSLLLLNPKRTTEIDEFLKIISKFIIYTTSYLQNIYTEREVIDIIIQQAKRHLENEIDSNRNYFGEYINLDFSVFIKELEKRKDILLKKLEKSLKDIISEMNNVSLALHKEINEKTKKREKNLKYFLEKFK